MEEHVAKDMSDLLFARSGVSLSPEEVQMSLQLAIRRKMGRIDDVQAPNAMNDVSEASEIRQVTDMQMNANDIETNKLEIASHLKAHINTFLDNYDSQMVKLASNQIQIPLWKPEFPNIDTELREFIWDLNIPRARAPNDHLPDMLLHNLGRFQDNKELVERLDVLFGRSTHKCVIIVMNELRLVYELPKGFRKYFRFWEDQVNPRTFMLSMGRIPHVSPGIPSWFIGLDACDIGDGAAHKESSPCALTTEQDCLKARFKGNNLLDSFRSTPEGERYGMLLEANKQVVTVELLALVLARLHVLQRYVATLHKMRENTSQMFHKRQWLYLQLHPEILTLTDGKPKDIFIELIQHITELFTEAKLASNNLQIEVMYILLQEVLSNISDTLGSKFDVAVDECCFIFTGTGLSRDIISEALSSVISKPGFTVDVNETGAFDDATVQLEYLKEFFPPSIWKDREFEQLRRRIFHWLRGRFTAEYISVALQNGYQHLDKVLNEYVGQMTNIRPADYDGPETTSKKIVWPVRGFAFEELDAEMRERIKMISHEYLFSSKLATDLGENERRYVEYGLARFTNSPGSPKQYILIDEPLVLLACSMWFNNQPQRCGTNLYQTLASRIRDHNASSGRNGFEEFICFYLQHVFSKPRKLNEVFQFLGEDIKDKNPQNTKPTIGQKLATLVTLHIFDNGKEARLVEGKINLVGKPSLLGPIGQAIESGASESLLNWVELKSHTAFCFPMPAMGPDIMCFLKLQDEFATPDEYTYICLAIQCKFYQRRTLPSMTLLEAIATITPNHFFQRRNESNATTETGAKQQGTMDMNKEDVRNRFLRALSELPRKDPLAGRYGIVRVICGFPVNINISKAFDIKEKDDKETASTRVKMATSRRIDPDGSDRHPLGQLDTEMLESITEIFHPTKILDVIRKKAYDEIKGKKAEPTLTLNSPGVGDLPEPEPEPQARLPRRNKVNIQKAEAIRKLTFGVRKGIDRTMTSTLASRKDRIDSRATESVLATLRADHEHWGQRVELKRKHEEM
ncbi:hypothetical protein C8R41DRAFT_951781 [Lentinula lateritia]|uniref:Uncharacterized protein n=1 Tax=Lentinula lateritia TaxID=40482 RepID=A0ABQ8VGR3_9AGAR|nr:hypothetical protein C8R41DRAFT_951781 [Lentinula lateritia]